MCAAGGIRAHLAATPPAVSCPTLSSQASSAAGATVRHRAPEGSRFPSLGAPRHWTALHNPRQRQPFGQPFCEPGASLLPRGPLPLLAAARVARAAALAWAVAVVAVRAFRAQWLRRAQQRPAGLLPQEKLLAGGAQSAASASGLRREAAEYCGLKARARRPWKRRAAPTRDRSQR